MYCLPVLCIDGTFFTGRYKGIVEFIMYGCTRYFRERYQAAAVLLNDPGVIFCNRVTNYMKEKIKKSSISQSGLERASWPLVCFGGLIDTTIKGLTILLSILAGID